MCRSDNIILPTHTPASLSLTSENDSCIQGVRALWGPFCTLDPGPFPPGRVRLQKGASLQIEGLRAEDQGWYECRVLFLDQHSPEEDFANGSWVHLTVNCMKLGSWEGGESDGGDPSCREKGEGGVFSPPPGQFRRPSLLNTPCWLGGCFTPPAPPELFSSSNLNQVSVLCLSQELPPPLPSYLPGQGSRLGQSLLVHSK